MSGDPKECQGEDDPAAVWLIAQRYHERGAPEVAAEEGESKRHRTPLEDKGEVPDFRVYHNFIRSRTTTVPGMIYCFSSIARNAAKSEVVWLA